MIDPIIFSFKLFVWTITLRWYGVLVMFGAVVGAWIAEKEIRRRGENGEAIWDAMVWVLPLGIIGARLWYVVNSILGGSTYYTDNPAKIINIPEGGLHFFGGLLFGAMALYFFLRSNKMDFWLFLDSIAPAILIGQAWRGLRILSTRSFMVSRRNCPGVFQLRRHIVWRNMPIWANIPLTALAFIRPLPMR